MRNGAGLNWGNMDPDVHFGHIPPGQISSNNLPFFLPATEGKPGSAGQTTLIPDFDQNPADNKWMIRIWMDNRLGPQVSTDWRSAIPT